MFMLGKVRDIKKTFKREQALAELHTLEKTIADIQDKLALIEPSNQKCIALELAAREELSSLQKKDSRTQQENNRIQQLLVDIDYIEQENAEFQEKYDGYLTKLAEAQKVYADRSRKLPGKPGLDEETKSSNDNGKSFQK